MTLPGVGRLGVLALAWSALAAPDTAMAATDVADQSFPLSPLMFFLGVVTFSAGLAMVLAHNHWSGGALPIIVTVVGWATLIKGVLLLTLAPEAEAALFLQGLRYQEFFHLYAAISLAIGIYLTLGGFRKSSRS
jgi:hypothetical protein